MTRRISLGQNTPLTIVWCSGFEHNDANRDGILAYITGAVNSDALSHKRGSDGGSRCLYGNSGGGQLGTRAYDFIPLREVVWGGAGYIPTGSGAVTVGIDMTMLSYPNSHSNVRLLWSRSTRLVVQDNWNTTKLLTPAGTLATEDWHWAWARAFIDNAGDIDVYYQTYENNILSSDNIDLVAYSDTWVSGLYFEAQQALGCAMDDCFVAGRTMYYTGGSGGSGEPVVGNTLTDASTTATCVIDVVYDDGAGNGVVFVHSVSDANSFVSGNTINDGSGWTATASNSLGNDKASLNVPEMFMSLMAPDGDSSVAWSSTGGSHYTEVDDTSTESDYVSTGTASVLDEFTMTDPLPSGSNVKFVQLSSWGRHQGNTAVSGISLGYNDGTGDEESESVYLPTAFNLQDWIWTMNTRTGVAFTAAEITALKFRLISKA